MVDDLVQNVEIHSLRHNISVQQWCDHGKSQKYLKPKPSSSSHCHAPYLASHRKGHSARSRSRSPTSSPSSDNQTARSSANSVRCTSRSSMLILFRTTPLLNQSSWGLLLSTGYHYTFTLFHRHETRSRATS